MFSLQFTFAAALLDGEVGMGTFTDDRLHDPEMQALLAKTTLTMDPAISSEFEGRIVEAAVELNDGRVVRTRCTRPPGSWGGAPLPQAQYQRKLLDCFGALLSPPEVERCIELAGAASTLSAAQVNELMRLCRGPGQPN
jgi:2-methylcitrate dehydratase PrpD